ncbi:MAG: YncE family protein, partial [Myxococcota bacterium]
MRIACLACSIAICMVLLVMPESARAGAPGAIGDLYVTSPGTNEVLQLDGTTGNPVGAFVAASTGGLDVATGLAFGPNGNLFVSNWVDNFGSPTFLPEAVEFDGSDGSVAQIYQSFEVCVWRPHALAIDSTSKVYLSSRNAPWQHIYAYDGATGACDSPSIDAPFASTADISDGIEFGVGRNVRLCWLWWPRHPRR